MVEFMNRNFEKIKGVFHSRRFKEDKVVRDTLVPLINLIKYRCREWLVADLTNAWICTVSSIPKTDFGNTDIQFESLANNVKNLLAFINDNHSRYIEEICNGGADSSKYLSLSGISVMFENIVKCEPLLEKASLEFKTWYFNVCKYTHAITSIIRSIYVFAAVRDGIPLDSMKNEEDQPFTVEKAILFSTFSSRKLGLFLSSAVNGEYEKIIRKHFEGRSG